VGRFVLVIICETHGTIDLFVLFSIVTTKWTVAARTRQPLHMLFCLA